MKKLFLFIAVFSITIISFAESNKISSNAEIRRPANFSGDVRIRTQTIVTTSEGKTVSGSVIQIEDKDNNIVCYGLQPNLAASAISCVPVTK